MIGVDALWLSVEPMDMRAGTNTASIKSLMDTRILGMAWHGMADQLGLPECVQSALECISRRAMGSAIEDRYLEI